MTFKTAEKAKEISSNKRSKVEDAALIENLEYAILDGYTGTLHASLNEDQITRLKQAGYEVKKPTFLGGTTRWTITWDGDSKLYDPYDCGW